MEPLFDPIAFKEAADKWSKAIHREHERDKHCEARAGGHHLTHDLAHRNDMSNKLTFATVSCGPIAAVQVRRAKVLRDYGRPGDTR